MKLTDAQAEAFLKKPDPSIRAVLVYGPDDGLVRERALRLVKAAVSDPTDPFLVAEIPGDTLKGDPARLVDEAAAIALTGGRRAVRVRQAGDALAKPVGGFLAHPAGDALVVLEGGDLGPRSSLRRLFEAAANAAALPCYADSLTALDRLVHETLRRDRIALDPDAAAYLTANLGADRAVTRAELEKLALYVGPGGHAGLDDAAAVVGDSSAMSMDLLVFAAVEGDSLAAERALARVAAEGAGPVSVLRALSRHLLRVQWVRARHERGMAIDAAMRGLRPPVFFKAADSFRRQVRDWSLPALARALELTLAAERDCKRTDMPAEAICGRTLLQIGRLAAGGRRQRR